MFSTLSPKERAGYFTLTVASLAALTFFGFKNMKPAPEIRIEGPNRPTSQPLSLLDSSPTDSQIDAPPVSNGKMVVHIVGEVARPGLYEFEPNQRVNDAIARAGGSKKDADLESVNLAAKLVDGSQLHIPKKSLEGAAQGLIDPVYSGSTTRESYKRVPTTAKGSGGGNLTPGSISLNTASKSELDRLPGVGPSTAQKILDYRQQSGGFTSIDEVLSVKGIGPKKLAAMRKYLRL